MILVTLVACLDIYDISNLVASLDKYDISSLVSSLNIYDTSSLVAKQQKKTKRKIFSMLKKNIF